VRLQAIFVSLLLTATDSHSAWQVTTTKDSMTDETKKSAVVINEDGHSFSIYRHPSGAVWANFSLSSKSLYQLAPQRPPIFRIDKNEPHDVMLEKRLQEMGGGVQAFAWEPKWVNFLVWHGNEAGGRSKMLNELMQGTSVVFRYYLFTGGYKETTFSLTDAGPAIADALGIPPVADSAVSANAQAFTAELIAARKACQQDPKTFRACFEQVSSCRKQANNDPEKFRKCLQ